MDDQTETDRISLYGGNIDGKVIIKR